MARGSPWLMEQFIFPLSTPRYCRFNLASLDPKFFLDFIFKKQKVRNDAQFHNFLLEI